MALMESPYILKSFGGCVDPKPCLILEFAAGGSLPSWLKNTELQFGWTSLLKCAFDVGRGLLALHEAHPQILHRDLKSLNILVFEDGSDITFKLCDFGLARLNTDANHCTLQTLRGTYEYVAPEVLGKSPYTAASDIYSYAIILYELMMLVLTGKYMGPYDSLKLPSVAILVRVTRGTRPAIPANAPEALVR